MIKKIIDRNLGKMAKEILNQKNPEVEHFLKETEKEGAAFDNQVDFMKTILSQVIIEEEEHWEEALYEQMDQFLMALAMHSDSYQFHVEVKDDVIHSSRDFCLPGYMAVSDLAYSVISAYDLLGIHEFELTYKKDVFKLLDDEEDIDCIPAEMVNLGALDLRSGSTIKMKYDKKEKWEFIIKCKCKKKVDFIENLPELLHGEGYNLWEDSKDYLRMLIKDPMQTVIVDEGKNITVQECADGEDITMFSDEQKENFVEDMLELKETYELHGTLDDDLFPEVSAGYDGPYQA